MDCKDGSDPPEPGISCRRRTKECGDQGRMPVVHVNDVGPEIRGREHVQDGLAKESEPFPVVVILIDLRTIVEVRFVHEIDWDASDPRHSEAGLLARGPEVDGEPGYVFERVLDHSVSRKDDSYIVAEGLQSFRQTSRDISKAAHLGQGIGLGRGEKNLHRMPGEDATVLT